MKTQYFTATTLDGFIATSDDSLDWLFPLGDPADTSYPVFIAEVGALAMGASTYEWLLRNADRVAADFGSPWPYAQPTWVFTHRTLAPVPGATVHFVRGDVRPVHAAMREAVAGDKNIWISTPDGERKCQLTFYGKAAQSPCWSPGGKKIYFVEKGTRQTAEQQFYERQTEIRVLDVKDCLKDLARQARDQVKGLKMANAPEEQIAAAQQRYDDYKFFLNKY